MANYQIDYDEELAPNFWLITYLMHDNTPIRTLDPDSPGDRDIIYDLRDRRPAPDIAALHYTERETVEPFPDSSYDNPPARPPRRRERKASSNR